MFEVKATQHVLAVNDLERTESYFLDKFASIGSGSLIYQSIIFNDSAPIDT